MKNALEAAFDLIICCVQVLFDTLSRSMDEMNGRMDVHLMDLQCDVEKMLTNF